MKIKFFIADFNNDSDKNINIKRVIMDSKKCVNLCGFNLCNLIMYLINVSATLAYVSVLLIVAVVMIKLLLFSGKIVFLLAK